MKGGRYLCAWLLKLTSTAVQQCKTHEYRALIIPAPVIHLYGEQGQDESDWFASTTPP